MFILRKPLNANKTGIWPDDPDGDFVHGTRYQSMTMRTFKDKNHTTGPRYHTRQYANFVPFPPDGRESGLRVAVRPCLPARLAGVSMRRQPNKSGESCSESAARGAERPVFQPLLIFSPVPLLGRCCPDLTPNGDNWAQKGQVRFFVAPVQTCGWCAAAILRRPPAHPALQPLPRFRLDDRRVFRVDGARCVDIKPEIAGVNRAGATNL